MRSEPQRAVIIGAGIVGICTGIELVRRGFSVEVIDRGEPGSACSFGNAGILGAQSCAPFALPGILRDLPRMLVDRASPLTVRREGVTRTLPWALKFLRGAYDGTVEQRSDAMKALYGTTLELHEGLAREAGVTDLIRETHYIYAYRRAEDVDVETGIGWRLRRDRGTKIEVLDGGAVQELEPELSTAFKRAVRFGPIGHTANPFRLTQAYATYFQKLGGMIQRATVRSLTPGAMQTTVTTDHGALTADLVVVAAGSWSLSLLEPLGVTFPLIAERGYHLTFANPGIRLSNVCNDPSRHVAISSMEVGLRIAGTEELGSADATPNWRRADVLKDVVANLFPRANLSQPSRWMGPRPGTPDSLPVVGPVPGHPNIIIATGHGHLGLTGAPMTARLVAAMATGERVNIDVAPYSINRFSVERARRSAS